MATNPVLKLEGKQHEFESGQLAAVEALHAANPDVVDLQVAENIGIVTDKTRAAIEKAIPNHMLLFQRAVAKSKNEVVDSDPNVVGQEAFKRAFKTVYGRFLLEQKADDLEKADSPAMRVLKKVLAKSPGANLDGRTELQVAIRRMRLLESANPPIPVETILEKAFGIKIDPTTGVIRVEGFEANFKHNSSQLEATVKYFESPPNAGGLRKTYVDLKNLLTPTFEDLTNSSGLDQKDIDAILKNTNMSARISKLSEMINTKRSVIQRLITKNPSDPEIEKLSEQRDKFSELKRVLDLQLERTRAFYSKLEALLPYLEIIEKAGIKIEGVLRVPPTGPGTPADVDLANIIKDFKAIDISRNTFDPGELIKLYDGFLEAFDSETKVAELAEKIEKAKKDLGKHTNLTDAQASKKMIEAMIKEQGVKDLNDAEISQLATMTLSGDLATLQTLEGYEALAQRGSTEVLETAKQVGFLKKLIGFRYKVGEKEEQPFKGLKPKNFANWASVEKLFNPGNGKLNYQNGFFALAAFEIFDEDRPGVKSVQTVNLAKKLRFMLAEKLGVVKKMDEAGVSAIVEKAFNDQMLKVRPIMKAYFDHQGKNAPDWKLHKMQAIKKKIELLKEKRRLGKIDDEDERYTEEAYIREYEKLVKEARELQPEGDLEFSEDAAISDFLQSPFSQWFKDRGDDIYRYVGGKAKAASLGAAKVAGKGLWGATKLGAGVTFQTALAPVRALKYPLMIAGAPLIGAINLFRRNKWTPYSISAAAKTDVGRVIGYIGNTAKGNYEGAKTTLKTVPKAEWEKKKWETKAYKDRTLIKQDELKKEIEELAKKGEPTPVEISESPFVDLAKYKEEIAGLGKDVELRATGT